MGKISPLIKDKNKFTRINSKTACTITPDGWHMAYFRDNEWRCQYCGLTIPLDKVISMESSDKDIYFDIMKE